MANRIGQWVRDRWPKWATRAVLKTWWSEPDIDKPETDPVHYEAYAWAVAYNPGRPADAEVYATAAKYAERLYDQSVKLAETLDKKLDDLMRNAGALGAILAAAAKVFSGGGGLIASPWMIPVYGCLVIAMVVSAKSRGLAMTAVPMTARAVLEIVELDSLPTKAQVEGAAAASYNFAYIGMERVNLWKSKQLRRATGAFCLALVWLALLLIISSFSSTSHQAPTPRD